MQKDQQRVEWVHEALEQTACDALVCTLPAHVLMLSGYCPVVGASWAIATRQGRHCLLVPEDERELAGQGWADEVRTFSPGSLDHLSTTARTACRPLSQLLQSAGLTKGHIAVESGELFQPAPYVSLHLYGAARTDVLHELLPQARLHPAGPMLQRLMSRYTSQELERIDRSCAIARQAFEQGVRRLRPGMTERQVAAEFRSQLQSDIASRIGGEFFCMSGPNAFEASAAFQISRNRTLEKGDLALIHCNTFADGFWTDLTRTYCLGMPSGRQNLMFQAVFAARQAGIASIHPGRRACDVDAAVRRVMREHGFGEQFVHSTGHGVGFFAINHNAPPRLHPKSEEILQEGMVFNVEPGIYIQGCCGMRHCDMVAVTPSGARLLTPFAENPQWLILPC